MTPNFHRGAKAGFNDLSLKKDEIWYDRRI